MFPYIYSGDFGSKHLSDEEIYMDEENELSEECAVNEVTSSLLLALSAGARVTKNLHYGVTYILCDIQQEYLKWHPNISLKSFQDMKQGELLHKRLLEMEEDSSRALNISLVSPQWIVCRWK